MTKVVLDVQSSSQIISIQFLQTGCPSCRPTDIVKALKGIKQQPNDTNTGTVIFRRSVVKFGGCPSWPECRLPKNINVLFLRFGIDPTFFPVLYSELPALTDSDENALCTNEHNKQLVEHPMLGYVSRSTGDLPRAPPPPTPGSTSISTLHLTL